MANQIHILSTKIKNLLKLWNQPLWAGIIALTVYFGFAINKGLSATDINYFAYLADAFLHGQLHLRIVPPNTHDLVFYGDKLYLYWLPMPAITIMPLVAIFGVSASDVVFTVFISAFNVYLFTVLLQKAKEAGVHNLDSLKQAIFVIFFAFGTVHMTLTPYGKVWQFSQEISLTMMLLAYLSAISLKNWKAFLFTGLALTGAMLTRSNVLFAGIWPAYYLIYTHWEKGIKRLLLNLLLAAAPILLGVTAILLYNWARFQNPFETGLIYHKVSIFFAEDFEKYGLMNIHFALRNFYYNYIYYPFPIRNDEFLMGGSLFLLSPVFFAVFFGFHDKKRTVSQIILVLTILVLNIPIILLLGSGWKTFGPRYTLDFHVPLLLLTAAGLEKWSWKTLLALTLISSIHYLTGTYILQYL